MKNRILLKAQLFLLIVITVIASHAADSSACAVAGFKDSLEADKKFISEVDDKEVAFVGTVYNILGPLTQEMFSDSEVIVLVNRPIKNIAEGELYSLKVNPNVFHCGGPRVGDILFVRGNRDIILRSAQGYFAKENAGLIKEKLGYDIEATEASSAPSILKLLIFNTGRYSSFFWLEAKKLYFLPIGLILAALLVFKYRRKKVA